MFVCLFVCVFLGGGGGGVGGGSMLKFSDGVNDWSVSSAIPLGWQLYTRVFIPKAEDLQSFPFVGLVCLS